VLSLVHVVVLFAHDDPAFCAFGALMIPLRVSLVAFGVVAIEGSRRRHGRGRRRGLGEGARGCEGEGGPGEVSNKLAWHRLVS